MSGIAAINVEDRLRIGFAIGAGCLLGVQKNEITLSICELLLASGYSQQYDFVRFIFDDLDLSIENDLKHRYEALIHAVSNIRNRCNKIFNDISFFFVGCNINYNSLLAFIKKNERSKTVGKYKISDLFIAINECLIHFETCVQITGMYSKECTDHVYQMYRATDAHIEVLIPVLELYTYGYQFIDYPLYVEYNKSTLELEIYMPHRFDVGTRKVSYRPLIRSLENIALFRRRHLRITLYNVAFERAHYDHIINITRILRDLQVISELNIDFQSKHVLVDGTQPWLRKVILTRILSMTNSNEINFPDARWWRLHLDRDIRAVKLEENALYAPLLPIFDAVTSKRRENSLELLDESPQEPAVKQLAFNCV
jgi:hypothetical protein